MTTRFNVSLVPLAVVFMAVALKGCPDDRVGYGITCPPLQQYSDAFLDRVADQIDIIQTTAPDVVTMVNDYGVTRDSIRKCISLQKAERAKKKK